MKRLRDVKWASLALLLLVSACGGGGGGSSSPSVIVTATPFVTPTPTPTQQPTANYSVTSSGGSSTVGVGTTGTTLGFPGAISGAGSTLQLNASMTAPGGLPAIQSIVRAPKNAQAVLYVTITGNGSVTLNGMPSFTPINATINGVAFFSPGASSWNYNAYTVGATGNYVASGNFSLSSGQTYYFALFVGTPATPTPSPTPTAAPTTSPTGSGTPTPTPTSSSTGSPESAFTCPSSDSASSIVRTAGDSVRRAPSRATSAQAIPGLIAVTYDRATALRSAASISSREQSTGGTLVRSYDFSHIGLVTHVLRVNPAQASSIMASLRTQAGVKSVAPAGFRRYATTVSQPYFTNDPYFNGFAGSTFHVPPYEESATVPGQWDMHAIKLEYAFAYSQANNGSGITNAAALGSSNVKIAVIDTGEDINHPELASKIIYQKCYLTDLNNNQSVSNFSTDPQGHGTDVTGIAAAAINNDLGFVGTGGNASIYAYRVFPTPDDNCLSDNSSDPQCGAYDVDIASALQDAVAQGVNVINLSLGGGSCSGGQDEDPVEGNAIAEAIGANIIVAAASGNSGTQGVSAPGCDPGVIAVGASALADGQLNGAGNSNGTALNPIEYVASFTQYGLPGQNPNSASAWGIVAPGGDPAGDNDADDLHWIEHIWTTTPVDANFAGSCSNDYPNDNLSNNPDCRILIAGTSQATPHVAGAAALILAVNASYQSPTKMKQLLCSTADNINDPRQGCGRLNIYRAIATALGDSHLP